MNADPKEGAATMSPSESHPPIAPEPEEAVDAVDNRPPSVLDTLRRQAQTGGDVTRRKVLPILPGRFGGALAARYMPADWEQIRKEAKRRQRRGQSDDMSFAAWQIAAACEEILIRPREGAEFEGLGASMGEDPVGYEPRLLEILELWDGEEPTPPPAECVRVLFRNKEAMVAHLGELTAWQREEDVDEDDDDESDPT